MELKPEKYRGFTIKIEKLTDRKYRWSYNDKDGNGTIDNNNYSVGRKEVILRKIQKDIEHHIQREIDMDHAAEYLERNKRNKL